MLDYESKIESILDFYNILENYIITEKKQFNEIPIITLSKIDNNTFAYNSEFDVNKFKS